MMELLEVEELVEIFHRGLSEEGDGIPKNETLPNDVEVLRNAFQVYGGLYLVLFVLFCIVRKRYPKAYNIRGWAPDKLSTLAKEHFGRFDWFYKVWFMPDDEFRDECGMDALCFTRILRFGFQVALVGMFNSIWLMPLYGTAPDSPSTKNITDPVAMTNIGHVPPESHRFVGTVVAAYISFGSIMYLLLKEFEWFTQHRHAYLTKKKPHNYTIYVSNIPAEFQSNQKLLDYFRNCYSHDAVLEAWVAMNIPQLENRCTERDTLVARLEHAINVEEVRGTIPQHRNLLRGGELVDSIPTYTNELKDLNEDIRNKITAIEQSQNSASFMQELEAHGTSTELLGQRAITTPVTGDFEEDIGSESGHLLEPMDPIHPVDPIDEVLAVVDDLEQSSSVSFDVMSKVRSGVKGVTKVAKGAAGTAKGAAEMAAGAATGVAKGAASAAVHLIRQEDGEPRNAGFVTFSNLSTTQAALQMIQHEVPFTMDVAEAPEPDDIYWSNVGKSHYEMQVGKLASLGLTAALCFFWTIPVAFVVSLTEVKSLKESLPFLEVWIKNQPWIEQALAQLAPVLIVLLMSLLPVILAFISALEGPVSSAVLTSSVFVKISFFTIIQTFFVSAISGTIMAELSNLLNNPESIVDLLARSLPGQSTYFMQILLVQTFLGQALELLGVVRIAIALVRSRVGPNLTEKERNSVWMGLSPLAEPGGFSFTQVAANAVLYFMVLFVYSPMAPITSWVMAVCFVLLISGYRYLLVYIHPNEGDSGGQIWIGFVGVMQTCMLIAEITIAGYLGLKKATVATPLMTPLIGITVLFNVYIRQRHFKVPSRLPARNCLKTDLKNQRGEGLNFDFVRRKYLQPAMQSKEDVYPENLSVTREITQQSTTFMAPRNSEAETESESINLVA